MVPSIISLNSVPRCKTWTQSALFISHLSASCGFSQQHNIIRRHFNRPVQNSSGVGESRKTEHDGVLLLYNKLQFDKANLREQLHWSAAGKLLTCRTSPPHTMYLELLLAVRSVSWWYCELLRLHCTPQCEHSGIQHQCLFYSLHVSCWTCLHVLQAADTWPPILWSVWDNVFKI